MMPDVKKVNTWLVSLLLGVGLLLVVAGGFTFWNAYVLPSLANLSAAGVAFWLGFAFLAGLASFFAPCAFVLFPGYIAFYLGMGGVKNQGPTGNPAKLGFLGALGILSFFLLLSALLLVAGKALVPFLYYVAPTVGILLILAGLLLVAGTTFRVAAFHRVVQRFKSQEKRSGWNMFLFGVGYGGASLGCTLPLLFALIVTPLSQGRLGLTIGAFLVYGAAMSLLMVITTYLVHQQRDTWIQKLSASTVMLKRISGVVLIVIGGYLAYYNLVYSMLG